MFSGGRERVHWEQMGWDKTLFEEERVYESLLLWMYVLIYLQYEQKNTINTRI